MPTLEQLERDLAMCKEVLKQISALSQEPEAVKTKPIPGDWESYAKFIDDQSRDRNIKPATQAYSSCETFDHITASVFAERGDKVQMMEDDKWVDVVLKSNAATFDGNREYRLKPESKEPATFCWKTAAKLWSEGVEIQAFFENKWADMGLAAISLDGTRIYFGNEIKYRRKPIEEPEQEMEVWVNVYETDHKFIDHYYSKETADRDSFVAKSIYGGRIACVKTVIRFKKGQGI